MLPAFKVLAMVARLEDALASCRVAELAGKWLAISSVALSSVQ